MENFSQSSREAPVVVVNGTWAVIASAAQVHSNGLWVLWVLLGVLWGRWFKPAGPGIVLLMLRMSPLLRLRISPLQLLPWGRLLFMVLWVLLLPWMHRL